MLARKLSLTTGDFVLTGQPANLFLTGSEFTVDAGVFTFTGQAAQFVRGKFIPAESAPLVLTGSPVSFSRKYILTASIRQYIISSSGALVTRPGDIVKCKRRFIGSFQNINRRL